MTKGACDWLSFGDEWHIICCVAAIQVKGV